MSYINTRSDSTGKLEVSGSINLGNNYSIKTEAMFMDSDTSKAHLALEVMKEFRDSHLSYRFEGGAHAVSMM